MKGSRPSTSASEPPPAADRGAPAGPQSPDPAGWVDLDDLIAGLSTSFIALPSGALEGAMADAQRRICECAGLDGSVLWQWNAASPDLISITHSYLPGRGPLPPMPVHAHEYFPWSLQRLRAGETLVIPSVEDVPAEAARDLEVWRRYGVKATVIYPLSPGGGPLMAIMTFHSTRGSHSWPEPLVVRLRLAAQIFANAIARMSTDRALHDQQVLLGSAVEMAELGFYELADGEVVTLAGGKIRAILGIPKHEQVVRRERWIERLHPEDRDRVVALSRKSLSGGQDRTSVQYRYCHPERGTIWIDHLSHVVARDADGNATSVVGVLQDITARKSTEMALHDLAEFNRTILASLVDAIAILSHEGRILATNDTWDRWSRDVESPRPLANTSVGTDYLEACRRAGATEEIAGVESILAGRGDFHRCEYFSPTPKGARWYQMDVMALRRAEGGVVVLHRDITERHRTEEELLQLRAEHWHAHRVGQVAAIAASLAHELNQPLSAILSNAQAGLRMMARPDPDLGELREILSDIVSDDKRAAAVIVGLRAMLRREKTQRGSIDLQKTIQDVLVLVRSEILAHEIRVDIRTAPGMLLSADRAQLQQVVLNLVMNAIEAMTDVPPAQRLLEISTSVGAVGNALIAVRDSGPGISEDARDHVFEAFWSTKAQGMGIGLSISRSIVESNGGQLWFENRPERGVTFFVSLPTARAAPAASRGGP